MEYAELLTEVDRISFYICTIFNAFSLLGWFAYAKVQVGRKTNTHMIIGKKGQRFSTKLAFQNTLSTSILSQIMSHHVGKKTLNSFYICNKY